MATQDSPPGEDPHLYHVPLYCREGLGRGGGGGGEREREFTSKKNWADG